METETATKTTTCAANLRQWEANLGPERGKHIEQLALMHEAETDPKRKRRLYRKIQVMHKRQEVMG